MSKPAKVFLIFTFVIMAVCWGICLLCSLFGVYLTEFPMLYVPYLLGGWSPTIASYIALKKTGKAHSFREWLVFTSDFKRSILSYLLVPILAAIFFFCLCATSSYEAGAPLFVLPFMIPVMLFMGGLEETGWRGILQPELEEKFGYTVATVIVAVVWWLWHLPLFYINGVSQYGADFLAFGINVIGLSFALSAIKKITNSTFLCVLFHSLINSLHGIYIVKENIVGNALAAAALISTSYILISSHMKLRTLHK